MNVYKKLENFKTWLELFLKQISSLKISLGYRKKKQF